MISRFQSLGLRLKGFKKVLLKDTKGVLTSKNNFKWVKETDEYVRTVLPKTGTEITETKLASGKIKDVVKQDGTMYRYIADSDDTFTSFRLYKGKWKNENGGYLDGSVIASRTPEQSAKMKAEIAAKALRAKREKFVEWFNQKFDRVITRSQDGSLSKKTYEKGTDRLVAWYDKDKAGNWTKGHIEYIPGGFGKTVYTETPKGTVIESVTRAMGNEKIERIEIPGGDWSKATTSIKETAKVPTQEEYVGFLEQLAGAFDEMAAKRN